VCRVINRNRKFQGKERRRDLEVPTCLKETPPSLGFFLVLQQCTPPHLDPNLRRALEEAVYGVAAASKGLMKAKAKPVDEYRARLVAHHLPTHLHPLHRNCSASVQACALRQRRG
jgi:hypothetical protein